MPGGYDASLFEAIAAVEERSFWFVARNRLIVSTLRRRFPQARSLLEIGCGSGAVLRELHAAFPGMRLVGGDLFEEGLEIARRRLPGIELLRFDAREIPFEREFDVVAAFDVLEHVDEDERVLAGLWRAARPGGGLVLLVPQHRWLWSDADRVARHVRRYTRRELVSKVRRADFAVEAATSFVTTLLPALVASRVARRIFGRPYDPVSELYPGPALNAALLRVLDGERRLIGRGVSLPAGSSLLVVARKPM